MDVGSHSGMDKARTESETVAGVAVDKTEATVTEYRKQICLSSSINFLVKSQIHSTLHFCLEDINIQFSHHTKDNTKTLHKPIDSNAQHAVGRRVICGLQNSL